MTGGRSRGALLRALSRDLLPVQTELPQGAAHRQDVQWQEAAICRRADPEMFFPIGTTGKAAADIQRAKAICARCPVHRACLAYALATGQEFGIWGGRDENERRLLRRQLRRVRRPLAPDAHRAAAMSKSRD